MKKFTNIILLSLLAVSGHLYAETIDQLPKINAFEVYQGETTRYFAATHGGLYTSSDHGRNWMFSGNKRAQATMVEKTDDGALYAFVLTEGLLRYDEDKDQWQPLNNQFGSQVLLQLSASAQSPKKLIGLNHFGKLVVSENAGKNWHSIKGPYQPRNDAERRGRVIYQKNCQSCHGVDGVGETYNMQALTDKNYIRAPAMDASEHAWHHTDDDLVKTILRGSPRSPRMTAWGKVGVTETQARDLVAYIKSLWTQRELDCQGPKHMQCMGQ